LTRIADAWRVLTRGFDAAGGGKRWPAAAMMASLPTSALAARPTLARKANYLVNNTCIGSAIVEAFVSELVGDGPSAPSALPDKLMRRALEDEWHRFFGSVDIEGGDLVSLLTRIVRAVVVDGEAIVVFRTVGRGELRCQIIPHTQLDSSRNEALPNG